MSNFEKIAQDSYSQGYIDALNSLGLSESVKTASAQQIGAAIRNQAILGGATGALGAEKGEVAEGTAAGLKNVMSKGVKSGLTGAGVGALLALASKQPELLRQAALGGGLYGAGLGGMYASGQNLLGANPHYSGHDEVVEDPGFFDRYFGS